MNNVRALLFAISIMCGLHTMPALAQNLVTDLGEQAWECSKCISVADASVVSGKIDGDTRAADGYYTLMKGKDSPSLLCSPCVHSAMMANTTSSTASV